MYTILGAGLSGISVADHLLKKGIPFEIYESKSHGGGHIHSEVVDGFVWDEGPHVSFTKHKYVKDYFEKNVVGAFLEYAPKPANFYKQNWIPHPAQANLYAIPKELREQCIADVVNVRKTYPNNFEPQNYQEWIDYAFGETFAEVFAKTYTQKYWTTIPAQLTTDWIGKRVYFPELSDMVNSANGPLKKETHYISTVRYPISGGFYSYIEKVEKQLNINYNKEVKYISFEKKEITFSDGEIRHYSKLVSTLPLPQMIINSDAPEEIKIQAQQLKCSQVLIVNAVVNHPAIIDNHWIYIYDKDFYSTRINFTDLLAPNNGVVGKCGIQVEVYFSDYHPLTITKTEVAAKVLKELIEMGLIKSENDIDSHHTKWINWANVIFDQARIKAQTEIISWLETMGMEREMDELEPMTDWEEKAKQTLGDVILAGRFAQWKYFWTDDCIMRGKYIADCLADIGEKEQC